MIMIDHQRGVLRGGSDPRKEGWRSATEDRPEKRTGAMAKKPGPALRRPGAPWSVAC